MDELEASARGGVLRVKTPEDRAHGSRGATNLRSRPVGRDAYRRRSLSRHDAIHEGRLASRISSMV
ncbi:hypothetical protein BE18_12990 [Sorangium cellulosum]|uniref:Uncharacterized protein n=1 Tax=Sorangium cellulosum TaxID=56 RepID=A0A150SS47_SORCE|nr:hypothetical protein BE18_12990 [Sorangium cellulosum]